MIYFDNASTTHPKPEVVYQEMDFWLRNANGNPNRGSYGLTISATDKVFEVRKRLAILFNIENPLRIVFTSNGTEGLNLALKGVLKTGDHVITTSMEHNSMIRPIMKLAEIGVEHTIIAGDESGFVSADKIQAAIRPNTKLIAMIHASNVTGTIQPVMEVGQIARQNNLLFLVDAAQSAGIYPIDVEKMKIDLLAAPGHKGLMGPQGTGFLYVREGLCLQPLKEGGTGNQSENLHQPANMPERYESGTLNTPGIVGLGAGVGFILDTGIEEILRHKEQLMNYFLQGLSRLPIKVYGKPQLGVVSLVMEGLEASELSYLLDEAFEIATRSGLHCAPLAHQTLGTKELGTVRFSFGYFNTVGELDVALSALEKICQNLDG